MEFFTRSSLAGIFKMKNLIHFRRSHQKKYPLRLFLVVLAFISSECSTVRVEKAITLNGDDWVLYGGNPGRTNFTEAVLRPPLVQVWEYDVGAGFGNCSAAVADSLVVVGNLQGELHFINIGKGKRVGYTDLGPAIVGTPIILGENICAALTQTEESLVAYDFRMGAVAWKAKVGSIETSPAIFEKKIFATTLDGALVCVDQTRGAVVWTYKIPANERKISIRSSPATDGRTVLFGADDGKLYAVAVQDGRLRWSFQTEGSIVASPSTFDERVFIGSQDGWYYALDADKGTLIWKHNLHSPVFASQAVTDKEIFLGTPDGNLHCLDIGTGKELWRFRANSVISAAPLITGDIIYVGSLDKFLYSLDRVTGALVWKTELPGRIRTSPVVWRDNMILLVENRSVIVFRPESKKI